MTAVADHAMDVVPAETTGLPVAGSADAEASRLAFRHWLLNGGGLYGINGEKSSGKRRSKKKTKLNGGHPDAAEQTGMPAMEARAVSSGGKKKTRRWLNDLLLRELAGPLDASDVASLYAPPPWGVKTHRPVLERITEISAWHAERLDRSLWDLILSSDMEQREKVLRMGLHSQTSSLGPEGERGVVSAAVDAWRNVSAPAKEALRRSAHWPMLALLEEMLLLLKHGEEVSSTPLHVAQADPEDSAVNSVHQNSTAPSEATVQAEGMAVDAVATEDQAQGPSARQGEERGHTQATMLLFGADDAFVRLIIHGLCQFHGLPSRSLSTEEARVQSSGHRVPPECSDWDSAQRVVLVSCGAGACRESAGTEMRIHLSDVLSSAR